MTTKNALVRHSETLRQENLPALKLPPRANAQADVLLTGVSGAVERKTGLGICH